MLDRRCLCPSLSEPDRVSTQPDVATTITEWASDFSLSGQVSSVSSWLSGMVVRSRAAARCRLVAGMLIWCVCVCRFPCPIKSEATGKFSPQALIHPVGFVRWCPKKTPEEGTRWSSLPPPTMSTRLSQEAGLHCSQQGTKMASSARSPPN